MIRVNQLKLPINHKKDAVLKKLLEVLKCSSDDLKSYQIVRQSIDARKKPDIFFIYTVDAEVVQQEKVYKNATKKQNKNVQISLVDPVVYAYPKRSENRKERVVVVGAGPAGLFCTYYLALAGFPVTLLERGDVVDRRMETVDAFWKSGKLDPESNVQFGEGGAGTFSDGKLNTLVKDKDGRNKAVLETFIRFGAKENILYDAKPHIGTDVLCHVVKAMREEIIRLGAEVCFRSKMTDMIIDQNRIQKVVVNGEKEVPCKYLVLALGHSARDTFSMLYEKKIQMEPKPFAVGFRVQHPQSLIDSSQYGMVDSDILGAAPYKVTAHSRNGRGVYSFCMCPGGFVVNASSREERLAVNGMSYSDRASQVANSAIIVSVTPEDFGSDHPLAGIAFQEKLEQKAFSLGKGRIPVQQYGAFRKSVTGEEDTRISQFPKDYIPVTKGDYTFCDLKELLPTACNEAFLDGMEAFGHQIKGFDDPGTLLMGVESRTSSPVRMNRDDFYQANIRGIYPCGEGAGYAGGITSAAMDGLRVGEMILQACEG